MFAACLTPDLSREDAVGIIGQVYVAEAKAREGSRPIPTVKPAEPRPDPFIEQEEGFPSAPPVNVALYPDPQRQVRAEVGIPYRRGPLPCSAPGRMPWAASAIFYAKALSKGSPICYNNSL